MKQLARTARKTIIAELTAGEASYLQERPVIDLRLRNLNDLLLVLNPAKLKALAGTRTRCGGAPRAAKPPAPSPKSPPKTSSKKASPTVSARAPHKASPTASARAPHKAPPTGLSRRSAKIAKKTPPPKRLTHAQAARRKTVVLDILRAAGRPLTGNEIIAEARKQGVTFAGSQGPLTACQQAIGQWKEIVRPSKGLYTIPGPAITEADLTGAEREIVAADPKVLTAEARKRRLDLLKQLGRKLDDA